MPQPRPVFIAVRHHAAPVVDAGETWAPFTWFYVPNLV